MAREAKYGLIQVDEADLERLDDGSDTHDGGALRARGRVTKYGKVLATVVLLVGAIGIYSVANSTTAVTHAQPSDEGGNDRLYEVAQDDSTAPPGVTVAGQLLMQVSDPAQFANDAAALQAVKESIAKIAGVPVSSVTKVTMIATGSGRDVRADFTIDVPADMAGQVVDQISKSTPEADSKILSDEIAAAGLSGKYPETKVVEANATTNPCTTPNPSTTPNPCATTPAPANPCGTTSAPVNPCATTLAPANPCGTTQAAGILGRIFR